MKVSILKLGDILLTSIQVELTDQEALEFQADVTQTISRTGARGLVIDITALDMVDSYLARVLNDTANIAQLLGAKAVLCGMQPLVALALVEMGRELIGVDTALHLDQAMTTLRQQLG